ncbi:hypothetical protein [Streptomyces sp. NBC_01549]|uniref:hypothetical protein n=1 Tax=Streptomyces sp. NBC_01549 TaxID=2975874 RepID=UPI00338D7D3D
MAEHFHVSAQTIGKHLGHALEKLDINPRVELTGPASHHGVVPDDLSSTVSGVD